MVFCCGLVNITMPAIIAIAIQSVEQFKNQKLIIKCDERANQLSSLGIKGQFKEYICS